MNEMMNITIANKTLKSPVMKSAGPWSALLNNATQFNYQKLGAVVCKSITKDPIEPDDVFYRILPHGHINNLNLCNVGMKEFAKKKIPELKKKPYDIIISVAGKTIDDYYYVVSHIEEHDTENVVWGWELNVGCPNVSYGTNIGLDIKMLRNLTRKIRHMTSKPVLVKLPPVLYKITELAKAAECSGANAITAINTIPGMALVEDEDKYELKKYKGGISGGGIFHIAMGIVNKLSSAIKIPIIAVGGISKPQDALHFLLAGAEAVQIGSANLAQPELFVQCYDLIQQFCTKHNVHCSELKHYLNKQK